MIPRPPELSRFSRLCGVVSAGLVVLGLSPLADTWVLAFGVLVGAVGALPHLVAAEERQHALLLELDPETEPEPEAQLDGGADGADELTVERLLARLRPLPELAPPVARDTGRWVLTDFRLSVAVGATHAAVVGEFNDWSPTASPMHVEDGCFVARVPLEAGRRYRFRYLLDGERWENDWSADGYVPNDFGGEDSVIEVPLPQADSSTTIPSPCGGIAADLPHAVDGVGDPVPTLLEVPR